MAARFKVDENLPREVRSLLVDAGHDAHTVYDEHLVGRADADILDVCILDEEPAAKRLWIVGSGRVRIRE